MPVLEAEIIKFKIETKHYGYVQYESKELINNYVLKMH
jgi:hypothetical protein